jgi:hypothetical protein
MEEELGLPMVLVEGGGCYSYCNGNRSFKCFSE